MKLRIVRWLLVCLCIVVTTSAHPQGTLKFGLDAASPSLGSGLSPADVLTAGPVVTMSGSTLGLRTDFTGGNYDLLNGLSYGHDTINASVLFAVDRVSVGLPGTGVYAAAQPGIASAASDVFASDLNGQNHTAIHGASLGLTTGFFGDGLTALSQYNGPKTFTYFTLGALSASNGYGSGTLSSDILESAGNGAYSLFATAANIGLDPKDQIIGLVLHSTNANGVLNPGSDQALFALAPSSPSVLNGSVSSAEILSTNFNGSYSVYASPDSLGLNASDHLAGLTAPAVPEANTGTIILTLLAFSAVLRMWRRRNGRRTIIGKEA